jgi:hypothetical protein
MDKPRILMKGSRRDHAVAFRLAARQQQADGHFAVDATRS